MVSITKCALWWSTSFRVLAEILLSARGSVGTGSSGDDQGAGAPQAGEASAEGTGGGSGGTGAEAGAPPAMFRMDKIRADMNEKVARPAGDVDAPELRKDAALREMAAYMKEAATKNDSKFDFLYSWEARGTGGVDPSGKVVVPARLPHIGLLARLYAGIDTTSCQAERIFSALKQVLSDMRASVLAHKTEKMMLLRLNRHLIPEFARVEQKLESLQVKWDAQEAASVAAQNARAGTVVNLS